MAVHSAKSGPLLRISSDEFVPALKDLAARMHDAGPGKVVPQIIHFLKVARSGFRQTVDMLSREEIDAIVDAYVAAARRSRACGFDGVELHMAHAYTLSSFLSRLNPRKDEYGGSLANRLRLPLRVMRAVRSAVGDDFAVGVRFLGDECIRNGYTVLDAGPIAIELARAGADYISLSAGGKFEDARHIEGEPPYPYTGYSGDRCMPGSAYPDGTNLYIPEAVRAAVRNARARDAHRRRGQDRHEGSRREDRRARTGRPRWHGARAACRSRPAEQVASRPREDRVVRCLYGNVCKALDENFRRVDCTLWPKKLGQAPSSDDDVAPEWPVSGAGLTAEVKEGRVLLRWRKKKKTRRTTKRCTATRSSEAKPAKARFSSTHASVRAVSSRYEDARVVAGGRYRYAVRPYDLAGNRGAMSGSIEVAVPDAR